MIINKLKKNLPRKVNVYVNYICLFYLFIYLCKTKEVNSNNKGK